MSIQNSLQIGTTYQKQSLTMISKMAAIDHDQYPIVISNDEKEKMNFGRVCRILSEQDMKPSVLSQVSPNERSLTLKKMDDVYRYAIDSYTLQLAIAIENDQKNIAILNQKLEKSLDKSNHGQKYNAASLLLLLIAIAPAYILSKPSCAQKPGGTSLLSFFVRTIPAYIACKFIHNQKSSFSLLFLLAGAARTVIAGESICKQKEQHNALQKYEISREQSASRRKWLFNIDLEEKKRINEIQLFLTTRMEAIFDQLEDLKKEGETDLSLTKEIQQLAKVHRTIFEHQGGIIINNKNMAKYLNREGI